MRKLGSQDFFEETTSRTLRPPELLLHIANLLFLCRPRGGRFVFNDFGLIVERPA